MNIIYVLLLIWTSWGGVETETIEAGSLSTCNLAKETIVREYNATAGNEASVQGFCVRVRRSVE